MALLSYNGVLEYSLICILWDVFAFLGSPGTELIFHKWYLFTIMIILTSIILTIAIIIAIIIIASIIITIITIILMLLWPLLMLSLLSSLLFTVYLVRTTPFKLHINRTYPVSLLQLCDHYSASSIFSFNLHQDIIYVSTDFGNFPYFKVWARVFSLPFLCEISEEWFSLLHTVVYLLPSCLWTMS